MSEAIIRASNLSRSFSTAERKSGILSSITTLFSRKYTIKKAVDSVSFDIKEGEFVGYVGENGAGKSTTIKMLTGILTPTGGSATVAGIVPYEDRARNAINIGVVFGQRTQLWWDLPVQESFDLLRAIFRVPKDQFDQTFDELNQTLDLSPLLGVPVRKLSLGQRMRCDLAAALLHNPPVLFLDEPTIGLDLIAKDQVRKFLKEINQKRRTTIILTTHDMDDIEKLCERIIILDEGSIVYDGRTETLKQDYIKEKILEIECYDSACSISSPGVKVLKQEGSVTWLSFEKDKIFVKDVIKDILDRYDVKDISIHDPKVEDVVKNIYAKGVDAPTDKPTVVTL